MKFKIGKLGMMALVGVMIFTGCAKTDEPAKNQDNPTTMPVVVDTPKGDADVTQGSTEETTGDTTENPAAGTSPKLDEDTAKAMAFDKMIEGIKSIVLTDLDGKTVERTFTAEELQAIETAFNESYIMDTAYIEMLAGYTMTIALENGEEVFITSYGDPVFIVARIGEGQTYHLGCEAIATILLEGTK